jgi:hypothetical protein
MSILNRLPDDFMLKRCPSCKAKIQKKDKIENTFEELIDFLTKHNQSFSNEMNSFLHSPTTLTTLTFSDLIEKRQTFPQIICSRCQSSLTLIVCLHLFAFIWYTISQRALYEQQINDALRYALQAIHLLNIPQTRRLFCVVLSEMGYIESSEYWMEHWKLL